MTPRSIIFGFCVSALAVSLGSRLLEAQAQKRLVNQIDVGEWKYPDATVLGGSSSSGSGSSASSVPHSQSLTSALMITKDDFEKVCKYYNEKSGAETRSKINPKGKDGPIPKPQAKRLPGSGEMGSMVSLDEGKGRLDVKLRFVMLKEKTSTVVIVISRAPGEKETHIAFARETSE